mgnify:CR=1 FL=1
MKVWGGRFDGSGTDPRVADFTRSIELDRALGYEANYAGTSFVAPPEDKLGKLRYGPSFMNIQGDRTQEGSLARVGWDDEGVPPDNWLIIEKGIFKDYQTTREQSAWIAGMTGVRRSHGCSFADSWDSVQFQRMPKPALAALSFWVMPATGEMCMRRPKSANANGTMPA